MARLKSVAPISGEDTNALPVKEVGPAIAFYETVLGFSVVRSDTATGVVARDGVRIGLVRQPDHQPGRAGSVAIAVDDLDVLHGEIRTRGGHPGEFGIDQWDGKQYRTFFLREDENGYCYCFYQPAGPAGTGTGT
jgi:hypothetical protein